MKNICLLIGLMQLTLLSNSQTISMIIALNGKDTLSSVSIQDLRDARHAVQDLKACNKLADSLWGQLGTRILIEKDNSRYLMESDEKVKNITERYQEQKIISDIYQTTSKRKTRQLKLCKFGLTAGLPIVFIGGAYLGYQFCK